MSLITTATDTGVARIVLDRPDKLNALSPTLLAELTEALAAAMDDDQVRVIVLSGEGRAFSAGADIKSEDDDFRNLLKDAPMDMVRTRQRVDEWLRLKAMPKPIIAQVQGYCLGLANELVGCCDLVVCSESARFGMPEVREIGLFPTLGFWPQRIGLQRTFELVTTGRFVDGAEAVRIGLAMQCTADNELASTVDALAEHLAGIDMSRLMVTKAAVNSWGESVGFYDAARRGAQFHALYHQAAGSHGG